MRAHPKELGVQMAATACLYNLSKGEMGQKIHPLWLAKLVDLTLDAMQNFPNHQQVSSPTYVIFCYVREFCISINVTPLLAAAEKCLVNSVQ